MAADDHSVGQGWGGSKNTFKNTSMPSISHLEASAKQQLDLIRFLADMHLTAKESGPDKTQQRSQDHSKHNSWAHFVPAGTLVPKAQPPECDSTGMFTLVLSILCAPGPKAAETGALHKF